MLLIHSFITITKVCDAPCAYMAEQVTKTKPVLCGTKTQLPFPSHVLRINGRRSLTNTSPQASTDYTMTQHVPPFSPRPTELTPAAHIGALHILCAAPPQAQTSPATTTAANAGTPPTCTTATFCGAHWQKHRLAVCGGAVLPQHRHGSLTPNCRPITVCPRIAGGAPRTWP